jgi:hypothetical protein
MSPAPSGCNSLPGNTSGAGTAPLSPQLAPEPANLTADPDLARVSAAWRELPPHIRAAVLALVKSAGRP